MKVKVSQDSVYAPSDEVVVRDIEGELIIVPLTSGVGDLEDELFTLNETGRAIWERLDGKKDLREVAQELTTEFEAPLSEIEQDVVGLVKELKSRRMVVEVAEP